MPLIIHKNRSPPPPPPSSISRSNCSANRQPLSELIYSISHHHILNHEHDKCLIPLIPIVWKHTTSIWIMWLGVNYSTTCHNGHLCKEDTCSMGTANPSLFNLECCLWTLSTQDTCLIRTVEGRHLAVLIRQVALYSC